MSTSPDPSPTLRHRGAVLLLTFPVVVLTGCSSPTGTTSWWSQGSGASACRFPAWYRVAGGSVQPAGDCAGDLYDPAVVLTMRVGQQLDVHMTEEDNPRSSGLVPVYPVPTSSDPHILRRVATDGDATASYRALAPGTASLLSPDPFCTETTTTPFRQSSRPCPVVTVSVRG